MRFAFDQRKLSTATSRRSPDCSALIRKDRGSLLEVQRSAGNQAVQSLLRSGLLQPKLIVGQIDDPLEREADTVAARIVGGPANSMSSQRANQSGTQVRRHAFSPDASLGVPGSVSQVLQTTGRPLDPATRAFFEPRLGQDLSHIRLHTDQEAEDSAHSIHALAYTVGRDISFAKDRYSPHSDEGKRLLAHELVHTVQQSRRGTAAVQRAPDIGGVTIGVYHTGTNIPMSGVKIHIDQKLVSSTKAVDLVTGSDGTAYVELEEGNYTVTVDYRCCQRTSDLHITANEGTNLFFEFGLCNCGIASTDQDDGSGNAVAIADSDSAVRDQDADDTT